MESDCLLNEELEKLEKQLLQPETRKSPEKLAQLLADEFLEIGSSGRIYDKWQLLKALQHESTDRMELAEFRARRLSPEVALTSYRAVRIEASTGRSAQSLRSSIWKLTTGRWQLIFHQGTSLTDA